MNLYRDLTQLFGWMQWSSISVRIFANNTPGALKLHVIENIDRVLSATFKGAPGYNGSFTLSIKSSFCRWPLSSEELSNSSDDSWEYNISIIVYISVLKWQTIISVWY